MSLPSYKGKSLNEQVRILNDSLLLAAQKVALLEVMRDEVSNLKQSGQSAEHQRLQDIAKRFIDEVIACPRSNLPIIAERIVKAYNLESPQNIFSFFRTSNTSANLNKGFYQVLQEVYIELTHTGIQNQLDATEISEHILVGIASTKKTPKLTTLQERFTQISVAKDTIAALQLVLKEMNRDIQFHHSAKVITKALLEHDLVTLTLKEPEKINDLIDGLVKEHAPESFEKISRVLQATQPKSITPATTLE